MLRGLVATMPVADLLEWMDRRARSGTVLFERGALNRRLVIVDGAIVQVTSSHPAEHLGRLLAGAGYVSDVQLAGIYRPDQPLGRLLVERNLVAEDELRTVLELKILEGCFELLSWDDGSFQLDRGVDAADEGVPVSVPLARILAEGKARAALWRAYHQRIPSEDVRFRVLVTGKTADELVQDVERGLSVRELMLERRWLPFTTYRRLAELTIHGDIEPVSGLEPSPAARTAALARAILGRSFVPRLARPADEIATFDLAPAERRLLGRIDGRWDAAHLVRSTPGGEAEALAALDQLAARGLIVLGDELP